MYNAYEELAMTLTATRTRRWSYSEFNRLADLGFFRHQRVELIGGRIVQMAPQRDLHAIALGLGERAAVKSFGPAFWVHPQQSHPFRHRYSSISVFKAGDVIQPLAGRSEIKVADLLP
jgi:hypothetical protein